MIRWSLEIPTSAYSSRYPQAKMKDKMNKEETKVKLGYTEITLISISFILIVFSFFAPKLFVQKSKNGLDFSGTGEIGDTIGGIMNPFIAIAGVLLTFLAFYIQYRANKIQREQFEEQLEIDKNQFKQELEVQREQFEESLEVQTEQFKKNQFENQFYEMVRLHKENVNEISMTFHINHYYNGQKTFSENTIKGREVFKYYLEELKIGYFIAKSTYSNNSPNFLINKAYGVFFHGNKYDNNISSTDSTQQEYCDFINKIISINNAHKRYEYKKLNSVVSSNIEYKDAKNLSYNLFQGYSAVLAHYYRHLYQTVKHITSQEGKFIGYNEKRKYLRILRAQLSNQEQAMLFYNWKSDFGKNWENSINKFFTDYRMIHNLYSDLILDDFNLTEIFDLNKKPYYRKETNRENDSSFEFQDW